MQESTYFTYHPSILREEEKSAPKIVIIVNLYALAHACSQCCGSGSESFCRIRFQVQIRPKKYYNTINKFDKIRRYRYLFLRKIDILKIITKKF